MQWRTRRWRGSQLAHRWLQRAAVACALCLLGVSFSLHTLLASQSTDGVPQLLLHPPINSVQNYTILDRVVVEQYPSRSSMLYTGDSESTNSTSYHPSIRPIYPAKWHSDPIFASVPHLPSKLEVSLVHATWKPGTKRFPGVSDHYDPQGSFVQGNWPDQISDLTFLPLLKNAHTKLQNALGDLRQRLGNCTVQVHKETVMQRQKKMNGTIHTILQHAANQQTQQAHDDQSPPPHGKGGHVVVAMIRDPIDRFLSATCQEMVSGLSLKKQGLHLWQQHNLNGTSLRGSAISSKGTAGAVVTVPARYLVDAAIGHIHERGFRPHQQPQVAQLKAIVQDAPVAVTLLSQKAHLESFLQALGASQTIVRDRFQDTFYNQRPITQSVCSLTPEDLTHSQLTQICKIYEADVRMMELAGYQVPLCQNNKATGY